jgi:UDP-N-acetylmuramyl pentapeptide phosphotransferase/UDP-N-acetylglucosamine-1-phosphate transferase
MRAPGDALVLLGLMGACLAFLRYNFHPANIFLGDTGSMFLGFTLGAVSLKTFTAGTFMLAVAIPLFVLGVPLFDTLLAVWRRSIRMWLGQTAGKGKGRGIMHADAEHLHHRHQARRQPPLAGQRRAGGLGDSDQQLPLPLGRHLHDRHGGGAVHAGAARGRH